MPCNWKLRQSELRDDESNVLADELGVSTLIVDILRSRGLQTARDMDLYLSPNLRHMADPREIPGLAEAAEVLARELGGGKRFAVWGDYDVDGVTSSAVVLDFLRQRGVDAVYHLPNRLEEGYGLNREGVERLHEQGVQVLLTVDCGISDFEAVARARELGMTVVVSDHHLPGETLPEAHAICNPRLKEGGPFDDLAGVGVAFMLMVALNRMLPGQPLDMRQFLDLVALGTIADVVALQGQNRILVKNGLLLIREAKRPGVLALKEASGYDRFADLGAGQVAFGLAPRINAAGRMGDPESALRMLLTDDVEVAKPLAKELDAFNSTRRGEEERILKEAMQQAEEQSHRLGLILYAEHWHPGIIGIVASRIVEAFYKPTVLLCVPPDAGGVLKGSGRSTSEFHLYDGLDSMSDLLLGFGGHKQAAGMTLEPGRLEQVRDAFEEAVRAQCGDAPLQPTLKLDRKLEFRDINHTLLKELELLQPFGMGNPEPVFLSPPVTVRDHKIFGKNHVKLSLTDPDSGATLPGKAWRQAENLRPEVRGQSLCFAFTPRIDTFNGIPQIELRIKDWNDPRRVPQGEEETKS